MIPLRVVPVLLVLLPACGGSEDPAPRPAVSLPATLTPSPSGVAFGDLLGWAPDGLLTSDSSGEGPSALEECPSPQQRYRVTLHATGGARTVADEPALFEPVGVAVSPDGANAAVLGYCDEEFTGVAAVVPLRDGRARMLPRDDGVTYGTPFALQTLGWLSAKELLALRVTIAGERLRFEAVAVDVATLASRVVLDDPDLAGVRPLPDGRLLALSGQSGDHRVEVVAPDGKRRSLGTAFDAQPSPDGALVAAYTDEEVDEGVLRLLPVGGGTAVTVRLPGSLGGLRWSPRSDRLVAVTEEGEARRAFVVTSGGAVSELVLPGLGNGAAVWSPEGDRVAYQTAQDEVRVVAV